MLSLDFAGFEDVQGQRPKLRLLLKRKPEALHPAQEPALPVPDLGQTARPRPLYPIENGAIPEADGCT